MTTWNYRVMRRKVGGYVTFGIYEVYYDDDGQPEACTETPVAPGGATRAALRRALAQYAKALEQPMLDYDKWAERTRAALRARRRAEGKSPWPLPRRKPFKRLGLARIK